MSYVYSFATRARAEMLTFQWPPEAIGEGAITYPHLHVGPAISQKQEAIRPNEFHKVHIPTGRIALEAVIRLAIAEFGVAPLRERRGDWETILEGSDDVFQS